MKVKFFATYRDITRRKEEDIVAPPNVRALLESLGERYHADFRKKLFTPDGKKIGEETIILVNGRNVFHLDGIHTALSETDVVSIFPVVAGG